MRIEEDIYSKHVLILSKDSIITSKDINKLKSFNIEKVKVNTKKLYMDYENIFVDALKNTKKIFDNIIYEEKIDLNKVEDIIEDIMDEDLFQDDFLKIINNLKVNDEYTYFHSVETSIYSVITGKKLNLSKAHLKKLGMGSILHDVGKLKISQDILLKPGKLTDEEFEEIKKHPVEGKKILLNSGMDDEDILDIVSQHHEKIDGSGYPNGLKGDKINYLTKIVSVSDIYDALTTDRCYRKKLKKYEAIERLYCLVNNQLDIDVVRSFTTSINVYPIGSKVLLNNGEIGEVVEHNNDFPLRPVVQIVEEDIYTKTIDMIKERTILIEKIIE